MSLWRVRHSLSPVLEGSLVILALAYGIFAIYLASLHPLVVMTTSEIRNVPKPIDLDTDAWNRARNERHRYLYGIPPGWIISDENPDRVVLARNSAALEGPSMSRGRIVIESLPLEERTQIENLAVRDLAGTRPALYDIGVHGKRGLFTVVFGEKRIRSQTVYVGREDRALVIRGGQVDPAAFSAFITTIKFLPEN